MSDRAPPAAAKPPKPAFWRRFALGFGLVLLSAIALGIWQRDAIFSWAVTRLLQRAPAVEPTISGARIDADQARLSRLQFKAQTAAGPLAVDLQGVTLGYALTETRLQSLHLNNARIRFAYKPDLQSSAGSEGGAVMPVLPLQEVVIDTLDLEIDTPQGLTRFRGRAQLQVEPDQAWLLTLEQNGELIHCKVGADLNSLQASLRQFSAQTVWDARLSRQDQQRWQAEITGDATGLVHWLTTTELMPETLRKDIDASAVLKSKPNLGGIQIELNARSNDNLQNIAGRLLLTRQQTYLASAELLFKPADGQGGVDGHLDLQAAEFVDLLKPWLPEVVKSWQFPAGNVMGTVRLKMRPKQGLKGEIYLKAHRLALTAGPVRLQDGYLRLDVKAFSPLALNAELDAPSVYLGKDTKISQFQIKAGLNQQTLTLERATLPVLGGMLEVQPAKLNIEQRPLLLTLGVKNLDLAQLLDSLNYPQLSGTGSISGKLPLRLSEDSIEVREGRLLGTRSGVLRYQAPGMGDNNLAFKALRNLRYEKLQATLNYQPSGDYQVGLRLEGKNPQVLSGHAVAFNLNLHGHLPDLLQKGIMEGDFEKPILEQVKNGRQH